MKRFLFTIIIFFGVAAGTLYAFRDRLAGRLVEAGLDRLTQLAAARGIELRAVSIGRSSLERTGGIVVEAIKGEMALNRGLLSSGSESLYFQADRVGVSVLDLIRGRLLVVVTGGLVVVLDAVQQPTGQQVSQLSAEVEVDVAWRHLDGSAQLIEQELRNLVREGRFRLPARISGQAQFQVEKTWHNVGIQSHADAGVTSLVLEQEDVREIAKSYMLPLTDAEVELVAMNPVRAPALLRISRQAWTTAHAMRRKNPKYPYDAFRHVYWSWMLTHRFGPEFSEKVTDAHEIRPTYEVSPASRKMDLHNNAVGRAYALANVPEREIVTRVLTDPNVIRKE